MKTSEKLRRWHNLEIISYCYVVLHVMFYLMYKLMRLDVPIREMNPNIWIYLIFTFGYLILLIAPMIVGAILLIKITKYWIPKK